MRLDTVRTHAGFVAFQARAWLGAGLAAAHDPQEQFKCFMAGIQCGGGGTVLCNLGLLLVEMGKLQTAHAVFQEAQCVDPSNVSLWSGLGLVFVNVRCTFMPHQLCR